MLFRRGLIWFLVISLCACEKNERDVDITEGEIAYAMDRLSFICSHEVDKFPVVDARAQQLYEYARSIDGLNGAKDYSEISRYYRLASSSGSFKATTKLHTLISQGLIKSTDAPTEVIDLVEKLIASGIPGGYYDMGHYLELGYGVKQDTSRANAYLRRAADLGNPDAQFYVSKLLGKIRGAEKVMLEMRRCSMGQGHALSALYYAGYLQLGGEYDKALHGFQIGSRNGGINSASFLNGGFSTSDPKDRMYYLGQMVDPERAKRYDEITKFLRRFEDLGATVPDIDDIVPLPPAKLPDWDGTFEWQRKRDSTPPPQKPSEEMIRALSQEKGLDPETGLPLSKDK